MQDIKVTKSKDCYETLQKEGLVDHYPRWETKLTGVMTGATLFGKTKSGQNKKVYVKSYRDGNLFENMHELADYAAFVILKECGVHCAKVKLKGVLNDSTNDKRNRAYIFSRDIASAQSKHSERQYYYSDIYRMPFKLETKDCSIQSTQNLFPLDHQTGKQKAPYIYPLDKKSIALVFILGTILNLGDLHDENTGFVISHDSGLVKAKLTVVDFLLYLRDISLEDAHSLKEYISKSGAYISSAMVDLPQEEDYKKAFEKVAGRFLPACENVMKQVDSMPFATDNKKIGLTRAIKIWKNNFYKLQKLAVEPQRTNTVRARR